MKKVKILFFICSDARLIDELHQNNKNTEDDDDDGSDSGGDEDGEDVEVVEIDLGDEGYKINGYKLEVFNNSDNIFQRQSRTLRMMTEVAMKMMMMRWMPNKPETILIKNYYTLIAKLESIAAQNGSSLVLYK